MQPIEQHIHTIDKMLWVMGDVPPMKVLSTGGRIQRVQPEYGNVYDHFANTFDWANGTRGITQSRQYVDCDTDISDNIYGSKGVAELMNYRITGATEWKRKAYRRAEQQRWYAGETVSAVVRLPEPRPFAALFGGQGSAALTTTQAGAA